MLIESVSEFCVLIVIFLVKIEIEINFEMEKKVFCIIGKRCKVIKFVKGNRKSDYQVILEKLTLSSHNDLHLSALIKNNTLILQRKDPDRDDWCDMDDNDNVNDKEDITVLLIPKLMLLESEEQNNLSSAIDRDQEKTNMSVKLLYAKPFENKEISSNEDSIKVSFISEGH